MFKASTILKNTRLDKDLELTEVSKKIKIPQKYLEAIESGEVKRYPQEPYCSLFVKDYADFLGLNSQEILSLFRRDFFQVKHAVKSNRLYGFGFTPQLTFTLGLVVIVSLFVAYLTGEYIKFNKPPELKVNWPESNLSLGENIEVTGTTDPESVVRVNQDLVIVDSQGKFSKKVNIGQSAQKVTVESQAPNGKTTVEEKIVEVN